MDRPSGKEISHCRDNLGDLIVLAKALSPHCDTVEELVSLCELAQTNDAQVRILLLAVEALKVNAKTTPS